jgi:hypothetical protein
LAGPEGAVRLSDGPAEADAVRRLTRAADAAELVDDAVPENVGTALDDEGWIGARPGENPRLGADRTRTLPADPADRVPFDPDDTLEAQMRQEFAREGRSTGASTQEGTAPNARVRGRPARAPVEPEVVDVDDLTEVDVGAPRAPELEASPADVLDDVDDVEDEFIGAIAPRPARQAPTMPEQGPALRAAALRGERSFGARGDAEADPSIAFTDELSAMSRDYADIEGGVGGFQPLKDRRIAEAMAEAPPPADWNGRASGALQDMRSRLDEITRHAGADSRMVRHAAEARFALDEAERMLRAGGEFGGARPADVYRMLNRANMSVGRAAAAEARQGGMGMQHTTAFAEPLTEAYQGMRAFLMDEGSWGAAARVQREMNASTAPLLRTGRALRERTGALFQDSGEQAASGNGFRNYETVRPEAVRGVLGRVGDDAYAGERALLRQWIENYGEQGATLARLADDPALAPQARAMQERAGRLLEILDRAEVEGRAAQMLEGVADVRPGGARMPSVGQMVRLMARIESGEITAPEMGLAMRALGALEARIAPGGAGTLQPVAHRSANNAAAHVMSRPVDSSTLAEEEDGPFVPRALREPTAQGEAPAPETYEDERDRPFVPRALRRTQ